MSDMSYEMTTEYLVLSVRARPVVVQQTMSSLGLRVELGEENWIRHLDEKHRDDIVKLLKEHEEATSQQHQAALVTAVEKIVASMEDPDWWQDFTRLENEVLANIVDAGRAARKEEPMKRRWENNPHLTPSRSVRKKKGFDQLTLWGDQ